MKKWFYVVFVNNRVINFLSSPVLSMVIPPIVMLYYGTLDIWGDDWKWIKDNKDLHEFIFTLLAAFTVLVLFIKGISEAFKGVVAKRYELLTESLISFFNGLVKKKRDRFYQKAKSLKQREDAFKRITQPIDQLEHVLDGTKRFLVDGLKIDQKNIGITIIQGIPNENRWWYELKCDSQKQHTRARDLMNGESTAKYCFDHGDSLFIPDLRKGIKEGVFFESSRSKKTGKGSIFCKPVRVTVSNIDYVYIFTIAVYGQYLCTPFDETECRACEKILDEVADRVELELYLHSMKQFRETGGKTA
ncbi:hypothetical protein [Pseudoalteromonas gelatinilytica]|uniref:GAF domain-containing protein n=1 Tax=Pseudoalteromonas gelatinilytica TaxID=1703256 RepID=A0A3A3EUD6_9GAMM|nr:hypothetical protein [Pseudoalteromonas profundi]RJF37924.1 hypothetical protein D4741_07625 [Pseudoalteromonas profundi]